ncbi:hypothetical protein N9C83_03385 [Opitutales bacterium]|nr:hypothetical protein [Opitutales bacterium]
MRLFVVLLFLCTASHQLSAQVLLIDKVEYNENGIVSVNIQGDSDSYYVLSRTLDLTDFGQMLHIRLGEDGAFELSDVEGGLIENRGSTKFGNLRSPIPLISIVMGLMI